jgi:predicted metal-dependent hydrolase
MDGSPPTVSARRPITPRSPEFEYADLPRYWFANNPVATHMANGVNLLFPAGERFFIRSVKHFVDRIEDPALRDQVRGFYAQEARHGAAHQRQFDALRAQGYDLDAFMKAYDRVAWGVLEPAFSPAMRLAVTTALEHYTAIMAEGALAHGTLDLADPKMQRLLKWHACEEIEHKAVCFDVLEAVAPSYALRVGGMALATAGLAAFWVAATVYLLREDAKAGRRVTFEQVREFRRKDDRSVVRDVFVRGIRGYLKRGFHPAQHDNYKLAEAWLAAHGMG